MKFKQALLMEPRKLEVHEVEKIPEDDDVVIKLASCGLCNWELGFWTGDLKAMRGYPSPLGHEWAGVVESVGPKVTKIKPGQKVTAFVRGFGGFAEYLFTKEDLLHILTDNVDVKYAMGEPQKCVVTVLRATRAEAADVGVVLGCGPMGQWCVQGLNGNYLEKLIAVDIDDKRLEMAKQFGATHAINSKKANVLEELTKITNGRLADFVIEGTGIPALLNEAQSYLKRGRGRLVMMSSHHDTAKDFDFRIAVGKALELIVAHPPHAYDGEDDLRRAVALINNGTFKNKELVSHEFPLDKVQEAFETFNNKPADFIKGIVVCN